MLENSNHQEYLEWVKKCIESCTKIEQLENCNSLVGAFIFRLRRDLIAQKIVEIEAEKIIESVEDDLLETYVAKEGCFIIPKYPYKNENKIEVLEENKIKIEDNEEKKRSDEVVG